MVIGLKRALFVLVLLAVGTVVLAERVPWLHARMAWLPNLPLLQAKTADNADENGGRRGGRGKRGGSDGPIPVLVSQARYADLPVTADVLGTVQATNTVTVRSQVDGKLVEVDFGEGQDVRKGDVLARVDPATFQAAYDQAVAKKAQDDSILANAQVDFTRYQKLAETQYGSHQQADTQKALVAQTQAIVQQDQAAVDNAKATLDYATIRSPIDGHTGLRLVDAGNIVHSSDTTGIVTIAQVRPIAVVFSLPQQYLRQVNAANVKAPLLTEALAGGEGDVLDTGALQVIDNAVDQTTGTVKLKASFPNAHLQLWPGQFVNIRLTIDTLRHVVLVPTPAVQRGPDGTYVYAMNGEAVAMRKVTVGRQTEQDSVITAGLDVSATVVTTGFTRLTDGAKVAVSAATASASPSGAGQAVGTGTGDAPPAATASLPPGQRGGVPVADGQVDTPVPASESGAATATGAPAGAPGVTPPGDAQPGQRRGRRHRQDGASSPDTTAAATPSGAQTQ